ncbi:hypothetical protein Pan110_07760 [Gimesia panareensis]|nr:hypothetical protein Pan110_07760 [Gimesia panareensis]
MAIKRCLFPERNTIRGLRFPCAVLVLLTCVSTAGLQTARTDEAEPKQTRPRQECFIKPLTFFNEVSWKEAVDISDEYQHVLNQFDSTNGSMLQKYQAPGFSGPGPGTLNPPVKNEDAMIMFLGDMNSINRTGELIDALLDKINQKQKTYYYVSNRYKLFCREQRPAYDALSRMGPNIAHATLRKIAQEPEKENRYYMAKLLCLVLRKKFALLYLEDRQEQVAEDDKLTAKEKTEALARYSEAIAAVKEMKDRVRH